MMDWLDRLIVADEGLILHLAALQFARRHEDGHICELSKTSRPTGRFFVAATASGHNEYGEASFSTSKSIQSRQSVF